MKKTLVDLTYFTFFSKSSEDLINTCYSTLGFLRELGRDFNVFFVARSFNDLESIQDGNPRLLFYKGKPLKKWQIPFRFNAFITSLQPDYILVHGFGYAHYLVFLKLMNKNAKIVLQCNGFAPEPKGLKRWAYKFSDRFIDGYLFTGIENSRQWYDSNILKREKIHAVMEGSCHFKFNAGITRNEKSYLWVGNLISGKDPLTVLKGFSAFLNREPLAKLTMVYQEDELLPDILEFINANQDVGESILLKGFVPHNELEEIYNQHQFFVSGSLYEGSGYALAEAMACGCVPVVTSIPPFRFMTNDGNSGFLFEPHNSNALARQLQLSQQCNYNEMQNRVLRQFDEKLSFKAIANDIRAIFEKF